MAIAGRQEAVPVRGLAKGFRHPALLEKLEFLLYPPVQGSRHLAPGGRPRVEPDRDLPERRLGISLGRTYRAQGCVLVQGHELFAGRHPEFAGAAATGPDRRIQAGRSVRGRDHLPDLPEPVQLPSLVGAGQWRSIVRPGHHSRLLLQQADPARLRRRHHRLAALPGPGQCARTHRDQDRGLRPRVLHPAGHE